MFKEAYYFNSSRFRLREEIAFFAEKVPNDALVLDAGCGNAPYRDLFLHTQYESADFSIVDETYKPTYVCDLVNIPVENCRYGFIIFNQVMEHLPEPAKVLHELHRVLKPGGVMLASAPIFYEEHLLPYDFFRYTQFAWQKMLAEAGFEIEKLDWLEGYYGTLGYQFSMMSVFLPKWKFLPFRVFAKLTSIFFHFLETKHKLKTGMPKNYIVIAVKPKYEKPKIHG